MKILGVIPARYKSNRFPGKPITPILGKPLILWVCERSVEVFGKENLVVATEDLRIVEVVETEGYKTIMTSGDHPTGTDRLAEVANLISADIYVNIQGDEPLVQGADIRRVIHEKLAYPSHVINAYTPIKPNEDPQDINIPKVLINERNDLIYMSRLPIPGVKNPAMGRPRFHKQVCIYAFNQAELQRFHSLGRKGSFEFYEDIEILRFFELGLPIRMVEVTESYQAVDVPEDVFKVEALLRTGRT